MPTDYIEPPENLPPLARGLHNWVAAFRPPERQLSGAELGAFWRLEFHPETAFKLDENTQRAYETIGAYRMTRMVAILRGLMGPDDLLADVIDHPSEGDPWTRWWPPFGVPELSSDTLVRSAAEACRAQPGVPLMPPPVMHGLYKEEDDGEQTPLGHWLTAFLLTSRLLGFHNHPVGRYATDRSLDPRWTHEVWPSREDMVRFEQVLMDDAFQMIVDSGVAPACLALEKQYGFEPREARGVVQASRARVQRSYEVNLEEERVLLLHRLDDAYRRAKAAMDLKAERNALKDIASILGLTRAEPEDVLHEMTKTLRRINAVADQAASVPLLADGEVVQPPDPILTIPAEFQRPGRALDAIKNMRASLDAAENAPTD
jgi:hypothetical protein